MGVNRNTVVVTSVLLFHVAALWALQSGLLRRVVEHIVPAQVLFEYAAQPDPAPPQPQPKPAAVVRHQPPRALAAPVLATDSPHVQPTEWTPAPVAIAPAVVSAPAPATPIAAPPAPPKLELPSSDADYLNNPKPTYPALSRRLGEQGKVVIRTLIGVDGTAQDAAIQQSSGFDRLDQVALATARKWRYVPGKRAGVPDAMWFNVPFNFVLE